MLKESEFSHLKPHEFVIHCYSQMGKSNAVFISSSIRLEDRPYISSLAVESHQRYQDLHVVASEATFNKADLLVNTPSHKFAAPLLRGRARSRTRSPGDLQSEDDIEPIDPNSIFHNLRFGEEEDVVSNIEDTGDEADNAATIQKKRIKKRIQLLAKSQTLNVHAVLHLQQVIEEYASTQNVSTLPGEAKHK